MRYPRITKRFYAHSIIVLALFIIFVSVGFFILLYFLPWGPAAALGNTAAMLGWIALGGLGLVRFAPRLREPHPLLMRFGLADSLCVLLIVGGLLATFNN